MHEIYPSTVPVKGRNRAKLAVVSAPARRSTNAACTPSFRNEPNYPQTRKERIPRWSHSAPIPKNWCEDIPYNGNSVRHLEKVLAVVIRLVSEVLRDHQPLLDDFNASLRLIRQQYFPNPRAA